MRRALAPTLVLAVALSMAAALPPPPRACAGQPALTDCELLKKLFCHKANQMAENNQLNTWKVFDDYEYNEYIDKTQGIRYDGALEDTRTWMYPSQFGRLQRGFDDPYHQPRHESRDYRHYGKAELPNIKMVYLRNKDILIENDKAYFVYDSYVASTNPVDFLSVRFLCRAAGTDADPNNQGELESQQTNEINPLMKNTIAKRDDFLEAGQKEVPDNLIFSDEEKGDMQKKLFALWSRMQSLTPKSRQLPARRHAFVLYGRDALSAETRAARLRPPGQPLRWG